MANNQSVRRHLDAFTRGRIVGREKLEEGRSQKKKAADSGRKSLDTRHRRLDDRYRVVPWPEDCTTPCTVCTFNACPSEKAFSVVHREHRNWRDNERGRVLFTDESRFSLSSDSHRILIWRERGSRNHPSNMIERDRYGGRGVWEASCLVVVQTFTSSTQVQSTGPVIVTRFFFHMRVFLEALWVCSSFSWTTMHHVIAQ
ncbi:hypothetical protein TNCV_4994911 [Trichonephila clavipes]|nr:hypothetical protein TNCV_4994911 [Trichonephila clavipes]